MDPFLGGIVYQGTPRIKSKKAGRSASRYFVLWEGNRNPKFSEIPFSEYE
jgi:hypothetical protein